MKTKAATAARFFLGAVYFVFGLNGFLMFIPVPPLEGVALTFMTGMQATGYFFPLLKGTEVAMGALLLANRYTLLSLIVLAPITLQIVLFHLVVAPEGLPLTVLMLAAHVFLGYFYFRHYRGLFAAKVQVG